MAEIDKMEPLRVENAKAGDARAIQRVIEKSWHYSFSQGLTNVGQKQIEEIFKNAYNQELMGAANSALARPPQNETYLVAKEGAHILGFVRTIRNANDNELRNIHASEKRDVVRRVLLKAGLDSLDRTKPTVIWIANYDPEALQYYMSVGFEATAETRPDPRLNNNPEYQQIKLILPPSEEESPSEKVFI